MEVKYCIDCHKQIYGYYAIRCRSCYKKYYWTLHPKLRIHFKYCKNCGKKLSKSSIYKKSTIYCKSCKQTGILNHNWKGGLPHCLDCGIELTDHRCKYCIKCMHKGNRNPRYNIHQFGKNSPNWQGGKTILIKNIASLKKYNKWRLKIFKRDNYICQVCRKSESGKLNVHHIIKLSKLIIIYKIKTLNRAIKCKPLWQIENGITLCTKCHAKIHNTKYKN